MYWCSLYVGAGDVTKHQYYIQGCFHWTGVAAGQQGKGAPPKTGTETGDPVSAGCPATDIVEEDSTSTMT